MIARRLFLMCLIFFPAIIAIFSFSSFAKDTEAIKALKKGDACGKYESDESECNCCFDKDRSAWFHKHRHGDCCGKIDKDYGSRRQFKTKLKHSRKFPHHWPRFLARPSDVPHKSHMKIRGIPRMLALKGNSSALLITDNQRVNLEQISESYFDALYRVIKNEKFGGDDLINTEQFLKRLERKTKFASYMNLNPLQRKTFGDGPWFNYSSSVWDIGYRPKAYPLCCAQMKSDRKGEREEDIQIHIR